MKNEIDESLKTYKRRYGMYMHSSCVTCRRGANIDDEGERTIDKHREKTVKHRKYTHPKRYIYIIIIVIRKIAINSLALWRMG
jgi:hypothetical protein